jgi:hypothetical protein
MAGPVRQQLEHKLPDSTSCLGAKSLVYYKYKEQMMGQARLRKKEIAEIKKWGGRLISTPEKTKPVMFRAGDDVWMIADAEFVVWLRAAHEITVPTQAQQEFARLALIAERSGMKEAECQQWFMLQLKIYADTRLSKPMQLPIVFATSDK